MASVRAALLQEILEGLSDLEPGQAAQVRAALRPATLDCIGSATRVDWLPAELHVELARAGLACLGEAGLKAWGRAAFLHAIQTSLLRPIFDGAVRVFGLGPAAVLRAAPAAWLAGYVGAGAMTVAPLGPRACRVSLRALPPVLQDRAFLLAMAGALEGVFAATGVAGEARLAPLEAGGTAEYEATWQAEPG